MPLRALGGVGLMGAACVGWAAAPLPRQGQADFALFLAIVGVTAGVLRLALAAVPVPEESYLLSLPVRAWLRFGEILRLVPWEEGALVAVLWLEVLHPARPWHTAVLGAGLIAYLLTTHLTESAASSPCSGRRPGCWPSAPGCSRLAPGRGCCPCSAPGRARRCCDCSPQAR